MNWLDMTGEQLEAALTEMGEPSFRAKQVFSWLHKGAQPDEMQNIPKTLREKLKHRPLGGASILKKILSRQNGTVKYLFSLDDGQVVEGVLMRYKHGNTLCISTQVGCRMGCGFCASTLGGLVRNLNPGEMLGQVLAVEREERRASRVGKDARAVTNIVLMGSGEPLDNYDHVIQFLQMVHDERGMNVSLRNISLSTCGLPDRIVKLAEDAPGVTLCVSLHAPDDELRQSLMPIAKTVSIDKLLQAVRHFVRQTKRRVIFEYALVRGVNDGEEQAAALAALLRGLQCHVNLIPLNEVKERKWQASTAQNARRFCDALGERGISATIRRELGDDIDGACGQLRSRYLEESDEGKEFADPGEN